VVVLKPLGGFFAVATDAPAATKAARVTSMVMRFTESI